MMEPSFGPSEPDFNISVLTTYSVTGMQIGDVCMVRTQWMSRRLGNGDVRETKKDLMRSRTHTLKDLRFGGRKKGQSASGTGEQGWWGHMEASQAFPTKGQHEKITANLGIQWTWQFFRICPLSLYFYPRERKFLTKSVSSKPVLLRVVLSLGVKLSG